MTLQQAIHAAEETSAEIAVACNSLGLCRAFHFYLLSEWRALNSVDGDSKNPKEQL
jgi:hypothetical protein